MKDVDVMVVKKDIISHITGMPWVYITDPGYSCMWSGEKKQRETRETVGEARKQGEGMILELSKVVVV